MVVIAIIQARMGSTRLPGKVMMDICGKPAIWHVIRRSQRSKRIDRIVVATTDPEDDVLTDYCTNLGVQVFRGANEDVLDRYYHCAKEQHADVIVRITADDVLVDPVITDQIIDEFVNSKEKYDYVSNTVIPSFPEGISIEVFSFMALETAWKNAVKRSEREHVTPYFYTNPDRFRIRHVIHKEDLSSLRWTLDYPSDLEFMRQVYSRLYTAGDKGMLMEDVLSLLKREPELIRLTEGIPRNEGYKKSLVEDTQSKKA